MQGREDDSYDHQGNGRLLQKPMQLLQKGSELSQEQFYAVREGLKDAHDCLENVLDRCAKLRVPKLAHMKERMVVRRFVLSDPLVDPPAQTRIEGRWIGEFLQQFHLVLGRLRKLHFKNLGTLLKLQESLDPSLYATAAPDADAGEDTGQP